MNKNYTRHLLSLLTRLKAYDGVPLHDVSRELKMSTSSLMKEIELLSGVRWQDHDVNEQVDISVEEGLLCVFDLNSLGRPLRFTAEERFALIHGAQRLGAQGLLGVAPKLMQAVDKLKALSDDYHDHPLETAVVVPLAQEDLETGLATMHQAMQGEELVRFWYFSVASDEHSQRRVFPLRLFQKGRSWYLSGFDIDKQGWRVFKMSRVDHAERLLDYAGGKALPTPKQIEEYKRSMDDTRAWTSDLEAVGKRSRVLLWGEAGRRAKEEAWPDLRALETEEQAEHEADFEWTPELLSVKGVARVLLPVLEEARVLEPPELIGALRDNLEDVLNSL